MLDIHGQPGQAVHTAVATAPQPAQTPRIPTVTGESAKLTQGVAVGIVLLVLAAGGYLSYDRATKQAVIDARTREVDELKRELAMPERVALAVTADQLTASVTALQDFATNSTAWSELMRTLTQRTISGIVLESVTVDEAWAVRVSGSAATHLMVAQYLSSLAASDQLTGVVLESSARGENTGGTTVTFSLKATFVPSDGEPVPTEEENGTIEP